HLAQRLPPAGLEEHEVGEDDRGVDDRDERDGAVVHPARGEDAREGCGTEEAADDARDDAEHDEVDEPGEEAGAEVRRLTGGGVPRRLRRVVRRLLLTVGLLLAVGGLLAVRLLAVGLLTGLAGRRRRLLAVRLLTVGLLARLAGRGRRRAAGRLLVRCTTGVLLAHGVLSMRGISPRLVRNA